MTGDDGRPDPEVAAALRTIRVPEYSDGFWERLEARLADEAAPVRSAAASRIGIAGAPETAGGDDLTVVPLAGRSRRSTERSHRGVLLLAAAAAIVVAVLAVRLTADDGGSVTASDPGITTTSIASISTLAGNRVLGDLHQAGAVDTPQDAFVSWVTAGASGNAAGARALVGPRSIAYSAAIGAPVDDLVSGYVGWADPVGRQIDVIDFGQVGGEQVAGLVLTRPGADGTSTLHDALPMVKGSAGWVVEPTAFDPNVDSRIEVVAPPAGEGGLTSLAPGEPVQVQLSGAGVYYVGCDAGRLAGFVPGDARDGRISWQPDPALEAGTHLLLVAHLSPEVLTLLVAPFDVG